LHMTILIEDPELRNRTKVFVDRNEGGHRLADKLRRFKNQNTIVLALPSGGVPIGKAIQLEIDCDFDLLVVRKIQIPWNTEAGFGAINMDGDVIINESLLYALHLPEAEVQAQIDKTKDIVRRRNELFRQGKTFPDLSNRLVILADDGLASGFTMRAAIEYVWKRKPATIITAVPTGSSDTVDRIIREVDCVVCLNVRESYPFAVAEAYRLWYDLNEEEVLKMLNEKHS
jgi:putative phosphoribosyl transferase